MTYEEFKAALCQQLKKQLPPDTSIQLQHILKNNGIWLDGLTISSSHSNISPTIFTLNILQLFSGILLKQLHSYKNDCFFKMMEIQSLQ